MTAMHLAAEMEPCGPKNPAANHERIQIANSQNRENVPKQSYLKYLRVLTAAIKRVETIF